MASTREQTRVDELSERFPEIHRNIIIKADVLREGVKKSQTLQEIAGWAQPDVHWLFEWDHDDLHTNEEVDGTGTSVPELFQFPDGTTVKLILDANSPYEVRQVGEKYYLFWKEELVTQVLFPPKPRWYSKRTSDGIPMSAVAALRGLDCFATCILSYCEYFKTGDECRYCCLNWNSSHQVELGVERRVAKRARQIAEAAVEAFREGHLSHMVFTSGGLVDRHQEAALYIEAVDAVRQAVKHTFETEMVSQAMEEEDAIRLKEAGVTAVCWNLEVLDEKLFSIVAPGKAKYVGRDHWIDCLKKAVKVFGRGNVGTSIVSGVEMAQPIGFATIEEALSSTLGGFEWLLQNDIYPRYNMWSNVTGSDYAEKQIPPTDYWLKLGLGHHNLMKKYDMYPFPVVISYRDAHRSTSMDYYRLVDGEASSEQH